MNLAGNIHKHKQSSRAASYVLKGPFDFIYIDANHDYLHVMEDIGLWIPKVIQGGFLGGHDYGAPSCPGVKVAVDEVFGKPFMTFKDFSWVVKV